MQKTSEKNKAAQVEITPIKRHVFCLDSQNDFVALSGDTNPIHTDPVAARRTLMGRPVVHGIHTLLWALDTLFEDNPCPATIEQIRARFPNPCYIDRELFLRKEVKGDKVKLVATSDDRTVLQLNVGRSAAKAPSGPVPPRRPLKKPADLPFDQLAKKSGQVPFAVDKQLAAKLFPNLANGASFLQIAEILATTYLVGNVCPGLQSLFGGLRLKYSPSDQSQLRYHVDSTNSKYSTVNLSVTGPTLTGTLETFFRPRPTPALAMEAVRSEIRTNEFMGQRALIIGGTRGLGEAAAKILAAGGAKVCLTYHRGKKDAERVAKAIRGVGTECEILQLDCLQNIHEIAGQLPTDWVPSHLYYFATPTITISQSISFQSKAFQELCAYYVEGLYEVTEAVHDLANGEITVFAPSTAFLDSYQKGASAYCAAKAAMEEMCRHLHKHYGISIHCPRLPKAATDQTVSMNETPMPSALDVMIEALRATQ